MAVQRHATGFGQDVLKAAQENPLSAALIGMGMMWWFSGGSQVTIRPTEAAARTGQGFAEAGARLVGAGQSAAETLTESAGDVSRQLGAAASGAASSVQDLASSVSSTAQRQGLAIQRDLTELLDRQPLALGAIGLCLGAVAAAAFPVTQTEQEILGEASDAVRAEAATLAEEGLSSAREAGVAAQDAAGKHGLSTSAAVGVGRELLDKTKSVVDKGLDAVEKQIKKA